MFLLMIIKKIRSLSANDNLKSKLEAPPAKLRR